MKHSLLIIFIALLACTACSEDSSSGGSESAETEVRQYVDSALWYIDRSRLEEAMIQLKQAEQLLPLLNNDKLAYRVCQYIGWINETTGANQLALDYQQEALIYARNHGEPAYIIDVLINQANTLNNMNRYEEAWLVNLEAAKLFKHADRGQKSVILKNVAYYEMLRDSLPEAERHAYRAAMLADDASAMGNALSLLCHIYIKQDKDEKAVMLMGILPSNGNATLRHNLLAAQAEYREKHGDYREALRIQKEINRLSDSICSSSRHIDIINIQNKYDRQVIERQSAETKFRLSIAIIALLLLIAIISMGYYRHTRRIYTRYGKRISEIRSDMDSILKQRNACIDDLKRSIDGKMAEINELKKKLPKDYTAEELYSEVARTKQGVDVLYAILKGDNISQMGRKEQRAAVHALWGVDRQLAAVIENPAYALTPKETFFCIMERYGRTDAEKAASFCCSEQAIRSTKSRLGKKLNLGALFSGD